MAVSSVQLFDKDQFLQLFLAQLKYQDPTSPLDSGELTNQLAQLSTFESIQNLSANFEQMLQLQQLTQGSDLLGRTIRFKFGDGPERSGVVDSVSVQNGNISLNVGVADVPLSNVLGVTQTPAA
jgi:flagellar basal-body rod modification protein FlgD